MFFNSHRQRCAISVVSKSNHISSKAGRAGRSHAWSVTFIPSLLVAGVFVLSAPAARAVPSFARQMNLQCIACHTEFPILTDMGRQFKLTGYTLSAEQTDLPPIAAMLQPSFTHTQAAQPGGAAPGFSGNNNFAVTQLSLFYSGRLFGPYPTKWFGADPTSFFNKIGIFSQATYDGVAKSWAWDNVELRYANAGSFGSRAVTYGVYLNNNPTLQDPWNSTPAWTFPFSGSSLAPMPGAATLINGGMAGQVAGLGAYVMLDNHFYFDVAAYRTLSRRLQRTLGVDPADEAQIDGAAPYWRLAYTQPLGGATWEIGTFGLDARTFPGRDASAGADHVTDVGLDSMWQKSAGKHDLVALMSAVHEHARWSASQPLGAAARGSDELTEFKATLDYLYDKTYGVAAQYFNTSGSSDALAHPTSQTGSPNSSGWIFQANFLPINKRTGPAFWPRSNMKLSLQYVLYDRFDGSVTNIDGAGRRARDNNTLYLEAWIDF